jgi:hypothetical protein
MPPDAGIPPAAPQVGESLTAESAALAADDGELPAGPAEPSSADGEDTEVPDAAGAPPRRRARTRRRRTAPERAAPADAAAVPVGTAAAADWNGAAPPDQPQASSPEIVAPGKAAEPPIREDMAAARAPDNGLGEVAGSAPLKARRTTRRSRRRATPPLPAAGGEVPELAEQVEPVEVAPGEAPNEPERDEAAVPNEPERHEAAAPNEPERPEALAPNEPDEAAAPNEPERDEAAAPDEAALAAVAMVDRRDAGPPRRGWWSRFVRKDE